MSEIFSINSSEPMAYIKICDYLYTELSPIFISNQPIIFVCIGSDRSTGDSLGPLIGYKLHNIYIKNIYVYGSLEYPVHAKNITQIISKIQVLFNDPYIIAIDSCLGKITNIGKIYIKKEPLNPGTALNKQLPSIGNMSILGTVNIGGNFEFLILQNTRLSTVMKLADIISKGIYHFSLKCCSSINYNLTNLKL